MSEHAAVPLPPREPMTDAERIAAASALAQELSRRRTVRDFAATPVPRQLIEQCLRAAGTAPSGANQQPWRFVAVSEAQLKRRIREGAEAEEREFYERRAPDEWLQALAPLATGLLIAALHRAGLATLTHTPSPMGFLNEVLGLLGLLDSGPVSGV